MERPVRQNWGGGQTLAPTERRTDPFAFLVNSLVMGGIVFCAVAWVLWRPLPFLDLPRGHFFEHFKAGCRITRRLASGNCTDRDNVGSD